MNKHAYRTFRSTQPTATRIIMRRPYSCVVVAHRLALLLLLVCNLLSTQVIDPFLWFRGTASAFVLTPPLRTSSTHHHHQHHRCHSYPKSSSSSSSSSSAQRRDRYSRTPRLAELATVAATATNNDDNDDQQQVNAAAAAEEEIESMVLAMSMEPSDDVRRAMLRDKLTGLLEAGAIDQARQMDACIVALGGRLQKQQQQAAATNNNNNDDNSNSTNSGKSSSSNSTSTSAVAATQIWTLVDMMVQTKTILNRFKQSEHRKQQQEGTAEEEQEDSAAATN
jgi:hypothetical protein